MFGGRAHRFFRRRHALGGLVGVVLVAVTAVAPRVAVGGHGPADCDRTETIRVTSSTEKAGVMAQLVDRYNDAGRAVAGLCGHVQLSARTSGATKNDLAEGKKDPPQVWLPTSSMWTSLLAQEGHGDLLVSEPAHRSVTRSMLVIAMPQPVAETLAQHSAPLATWKDVLDLARKGWSAYGRPDWGKFVLGRDNAETSTSGLAATVATYLAAAHATGTATTPTSDWLNDPDVVGFVHGIESSVSRYGDEAVLFMQQIYDAEQKQDEAAYRPYVDAIVIQEQMVYLYNRGAPGGDPAQMSDERQPRRPLRVVYPQDGTLELDHPFVVLASATPPQRRVAEDFYRFLVEDDQQRLFADVGFRPLPASSTEHGGNSENGENGEQATATRPTEQLVRTLGIPADQMPALVPIPDGKLLAAMLENWDRVRRKARVLLLDVSGSMNEPVDDPDKAVDRTKLQLMIPAAERALTLLDDDDEVGLWTFSSGPAYTEVVPVSPVGTVRAALQERLRGLRARGDTALFEATQRASEMMTANADPERINAIVLLSDGQNTEPYRGDAKALLAALDPGTSDTPVRIFTVPYGRADNADVGTLAEIARLTRAAQYDARNPLDIDAAFVRVFRNFG
ncbi:hypothetical protein ACG83_12420 [Frankia sp. R43]|uniref:substrate-binding and vWA domain-containing protein n=1 Tax=Frankia sp. R43 TaxID=269536 RepID=UPI0006CA5089|nr:VWA domain-containing protein [Frankia sp. R43]KPM55993.1 hypothetical protein ACG83_12420 [Frankia sp. R43]